MISVQTEDLRVTGRDFLRYSPDSPCNPQGLPFYTKARNLLILSIISPYIPITNATVKPPLLQPIEEDHHPKPHLVVTHMWLWLWPDTRRGFRGISDRFIVDPETMAQKVLVNTQHWYVSITFVSQNSVKFANYIFPARFVIWWFLQDLKNIFFFILKILFNCQNVWKKYIWISQFFLGNGMVTIVAQERKWGCKCRQLIKWVVATGVPHSHITGEIRFCLRGLWCTVTRGHRGRMAGGL